MAMASSSCSGRAVIERHAASSCMIKPAVPMQPHCMFLSSVDISMRWYDYAVALFIYKLEEGGDAYERAVEKLKLSLSQALVVYYPWAGRLVEQADGRLSIQCSNAGVEFVEAFISLPISSLEKDNFQTKSFFQNFCPITHTIKWSDYDLPLLSIQVTKFPNDEAIALGVSFSHVVADGHAAFNFFKSWGECSRGLEMSLPPIHMREKLYLQMLIKPWVNTQGSLSTYGKRLCLKWSISGVLTQYDFHFSSQTVAKLKKMATSGLAFCSTFQALVAHIWNHVSQAEDLKGSNEYGLVMFGDLRMQLRPPLPQGYFGNVIMRRCTKAKVESLRKESLSDIVKRVKDVTQSMDDRNFRTYVNDLETLPTSDWLDKSDHKTPNLLISGSPKFPVYDVEFGWGKPSCVRSPQLLGHGQTFLWVGKDQDGSVDVSLVLNVSTMERLKQDTSFLVL